jgi:peptidoglycan/xylan/chitin deacetylase (PgdA/CDA1 family)
MPPARAVFVAANLAAMVLTVVSLLHGPPPLGWAIAAGVTYLLVLLGGVFVLRWRMFVDAMVRGPKRARGVALTFDDGPDPATTTRVLDALDARQVKATFFVVGEKAERHPEIVRDMLARGHTVGLHAYRHLRLYATQGEKAVARDVTRGLEVLEGITGTRPAWFRPPIGHTQPGMARALDKLDLLTIGWTVSAHDGARWIGDAEVIGRMRRLARDGAILALHDAAEHGDRVPAGVTPLPALLEVLEALNLPVVPLGDWVAEVES